MNLPIQITFRHMQPSPALEERIRKLMGRLEKFSTHIIHCHVVLEEPHRHGRQGALFEFRVEITVPEETIVVARAHDLNHAHESAYVSLRDAFRSARRKLEDYERKHRKAVKAHAEPVQRI
jgi:ribosomal subunit interface protein